MSVGGWVGGDVVVVLFRGNFLCAVVFTSGFHRHHQQFDVMGQRGKEKIDKQIHYHTSLQKCIKLLEEEPKNDRRK